MRTLFDTCVVSALRHDNREERVRNRLLLLAPADCYLSAVTLGELHFGIERMAAGRKRQALTVWLARIELIFEGRILPFDKDAARMWGLLLAAGRTLPLEDAQIAATALCWDMRLATRNVRDFEGTGVELVDPWESSF